METNWRQSPQLLAPVISTMVTGSISFISSSIIIAMILRSNLKLTTVYRRLIFGMSTFDLIQSLSQAFSSLPMPVGSMWAAIGNKASCNVQGFTTTIGASGSTLYSLSLGIYFLSVIRFEITDAKVKSHVEPFLHAFPILFALSIAIYLAIKDYYNPNLTACFMLPKQVMDCMKSSPDATWGECMKEFDDIGIVSAMVLGSCSLSLLGNSYIFVLIWYKDYKQSVLVQRDRLERELQQQQARNSSAPSGLLVSYLSRPSRASIQRRKEIVKRALTYIIGYLTTYSMSIVVQLYQFFSRKNPPFVLALIARTLFPLQGFINVLIYSYPHVLAYCRNRNCSWLEGFVAVIKSGGDNDQQRPLRSLGGRRYRIRSNVMRNEPVVTNGDNILHTIEKSHTRHEDPSIVLEP